MLAEFDDLFFADVIADSRQHRVDVKLNDLKATVVVAAVQAVAKTGRFGTRSSGGAVCLLF